VPGSPPWLQLAVRLMGSTRDTLRHGRTPSLLIEQSAPDASLGLDTRLRASRAARVPPHVIHDVLARDSALGCGSKVESHVT
jgi:hypothetical protein